MKDWKSYIKGKKITVMGLGLLGRGIGDVAFLAKEGAELIVTDLKTKEELASSLDALKEFSNIQFVLGEHRLEDFRNRDFILKAAGVPMDSPFIAEAQKNNIPVEMSTALFAAFTPATVVGVTGTRGKSTVTQLLFEVFERAYSGSDKKVFIGGNVRGISTLPLLRETKEGDIAVLELDSWQLQGFGSRKISPHISVFTTFMSDHLNYYKNDLRQYFKDKSFIFLNQSEHDVCVVGKDVANLDLLHEYKDRIKSSMITAEVTDVPSDWNVHILGEHNKLNIALAYKAAQVAGIDARVVREVVENFKGVPGRLEFLKEYKGIKIYNDTNATTPDATLAALRALQKNIVLIVGGADKQIDMSRLTQALPHFVKALVLLKGTGTERVKKDIESTRIQFVEVGGMQEAVEKALGFAQVGDTLLLSPAFASFGMFKNEYDRGDQFVTIIKNLI